MPSPSLLPCSVLTCQCHYTPTPFTQPFESAPTGACTVVDKCFILPERPLRHHICLWLSACWIRAHTLFQKWVHSTLWFKYACSPRMSSMWFDCDIFVWVCISCPMLVHTHFRYLWCFVSCFSFIYCDFSVLCWMMSLLFSLCIHAQPPLLAATS